MFFFKRKKLLEIEAKLDLIITQQVEEDKKQAEISSKMQELENKIELLEQRYNKSTDSLSQVINEEANAINLKLAESCSIMDKLMGKIQSTSTDNQNILNQTIHEIVTELRSLGEELLNNQTCYAKDNKNLIDELYIRIDGAENTNSEKMNKLKGDMTEKLDVIDSTLRLLLLNSVMDQIER